MLKKNDKVSLDITDYTDEGLGVGRAGAVEGAPALFVKDTAVGDRIEAVVTKLRKSYGYARLLSVIKPSEDRVDPECPVASACGGCSLRHISYDAQLAWKEKRVADCMQRIGGLMAGSDFEMLRISGMEEPSRYRNKAQYPVSKKDGRTITGFYAGRTHTVVGSDDCLIEPESFARILKIIREYADERAISVYDETTGKGLLRHILLREGMEGKELMACVIVNAPPGDSRLSVFEGLSGRLKECTEIKTFILSHNTARTNVILGKKETVLFGEGYIRDRIGTKTYEISAGSFYQVNPAQTGVLYEKARQAASLTGKEIVWDLYCGTGTISLFLAEGAGHVYGVEIAESAVKDAVRNAALNCIDNADFFCGRAEDIVVSGVKTGDVSDKQKKALEDEEYNGSNLESDCGNGKKLKIVRDVIKLPPPDVIVVDPPRKGCDGKLIDTIIHSGTSRLVYVSCNPATLARDAALLKGGGFTLETLQPVDMFPHTTGVECVAVFTNSG